MTTLEAAYSRLRWLEHPLDQRVHRTLRQLEGERPLRILDVGGRRSAYTRGLKSRVTISDLPRVSTLHQQLDLGATEAIRQRVLAQRSNIEDYVWDDMTASRLPDQSFDVVVAKEVLEHVQYDAAFVQHAARVLKPGGTFLMTTPNGDMFPTPYPADHKRHYRGAQLLALLLEAFSRAKVDYAVNAWRLVAWAGMSNGRLIEMIPRAPILGAVSLLERLGVGGHGPTGKRHLVAVADR